MFTEAFAIRITHPEAFRRDILKHIPYTGHVPNCHPGYPLPDQRSENVRREFFGA